MKNHIPRKKIKELIDFITNVIQIEAARIGLHETNKDKLLNDTIIKIKKENPASSSWIYETINNSNIFKKFIHNLDLEETVSKLIGVENIKNIGTVTPALRIDTPHDVKNTRDWHQDGNYFLDNFDGSNSLVVWISLVDATRENGSVIVCPTSQQEKKVEPTFQKADKLTSEQYVTPQEIVDKYKKIHLNTKVGDLVFLQMDVIHRSGYNSSDNVRYTAQIRFTNIEKDDYRPPRYILEYPKYPR